MLKGVDGGADGGVKRTRFQSRVCKGSMPTTPSTGYVIQLISTTLPINTVISTTNSLQVVLKYCRH